MSKSKIVLIGGGILVAVLAVIAVILAQRPVNDMSACSGGEYCKKLRELSIEGITNNMPLLIIVAVSIIVIIVVALYIKSKNKTR